MKTLSMSNIISVEVILHKHDVFVNGFTNDTAHMNDEYTVVNYIRLEHCIKAEKFEKEKINACVEHWLSDSQSSRPIILVAKSIKRWLSNGTYYRFLRSN